MSGRALSSVSIDLDPIGCYYAIHGLGDPPPRLAEVILRRGLPRFLEMFARRGISATFFVVGTDLDTDSGRSLLRDAARQGHELGNHSYRHPYSLPRLARAEIADEVDRAHERIAAVAGAPPVGFRAPGYNLSSLVLDVLMERDYRYDSSILPAPAYMGAKALVMGGMRLVGQSSRSALGDPRMTLAPLMPYRPDARAPWRTGQASIVELPMSVSPTLRVPVIGTSVLASPDWARARLLESIRGQRFFNFELHGIDLIGAEEDGIPGELVAKQPDLRVSLTHKTRALEATLDRVAMDFDFAPLKDVAAVVQRQGEV